ncbi:hypothetical protein [Sphingomonas sp.]|jgi:hypothetical protein|uniref:hypothetical protein n=1 Tax=Sphingomonas sp. TaxID=28214 RepID=UPI002DEF093D|nr:hypothetical protein [Sphingomonas sp.]
MSTTGRGWASDVEGQFWEIVDKAGRVLAVFDHQRFHRIMSGARVQFWDENGDGICEHVQSAADVDAIFSIAASDGNRFGWGAKKVLGAYVVKALSNGSDTPEAIRPRLAAVRTGAASGQGLVTVTLLRDNGFVI